MELRKYQREAALAGLAALKRRQHPVLHLATGTGKSLIIAEIALRYRMAGLNVWVLTHIQQLVEQNAKAYAQHSPRPEHGLVCAALGPPRWAQVTFGTVQSVLRPALEGRAPRKPHLIIVDEAHRVPHRDPDDSGGQYDRLFNAYRDTAQRLALTATPWRMDNGLIYGDDPERFWFDTLAYSYPVPRAVAEGWLAPLVGVDTEVQLDLEGVRIDGDYVLSDVGERATAEWLRAVADSVGYLARNRRHVAVYCPTIEAATRAQIAIAQATGWSCATVTGGHTAEERRELLGRFRRQELRVLCSVDTLTTGFDLPALDCIVCLRPTVSSSLWVQIQGRGTRLSPAKQNCLVLDYVGNLQRLGGVGMYDTYVREAGGQVAETVEADTPRRPRAGQRVRRTLPGVSSLEPLDPMTGHAVADGQVINVSVHAVNAVPITVRSTGRRVLMVNYVCSTPENARINAARFVNTLAPGGFEREFFKQRRLAVGLPAEPGDLVWPVRNARTPHAVRVQRRGRYWNVVGEDFEGMPAA